MSDDERPARTMDEELSEIAASLYERARLEIEESVSTPERSLAYGFAVGAVLKASDEWRRLRGKP